MGYIPFRINYSKCKDGIPPKIIPIVKTENHNTKAFKYSQKVNQFKRPKKVQVAVNVNVQGQSTGAPGGSGGPPRNF